MATNASIISYDYSGYTYDNSADIEEEYNESINTYSIEIASNSWGHPVSGTQCDRMGDYTTVSELFDKIVRGNLGKAIVVVFSGGNERNDNNCGTDPTNYSNNYNTTNPPKPAKNIITVGGVNSNDNSMTDFSSWGPVDDGRIKPDIVGPGCQVGGDWGIRSTVPTDNYDEMCGTSMAAPAVSGVVALMIQQYRITHGKDPYPSVIKALLIHTAKDLDDITPYYNTGPDYASGFGIINATFAIDTIINGIIKEGSISTTGEVYSYDMSVSGNEPLKITLVWDDESATPFSDKQLVNDLDLLLIDQNNNSYYPWILDPNNPSNPAITGADHINNVEQVYVSNPVVGEWTIKVNGSNIISSQNYSLVGIKCSCTSWTAGSCGGGSCLGSEKQYTRTCTPSGCGDESKCEYDLSCGSSEGVDITVCQNGSCSYTAIQTALDNSNENDTILITDNQIYNENIVIDPTTSPWIDCQAGANIHGTTGDGIYVIDITYNGFVIKGCYIDGFTNGIHVVNSSYGLIKNNSFEDNTFAIYLEEETHNNKIEENNINGNNNRGVKIEGPSAVKSPSYNKIKTNLIKDNAYRGISFDFGIWNNIEDNNISGNNDYGIFIYTDELNANNLIKDNQIYNHDKGLYFEYSNLNDMYNNTFCSSNTNLDIDIGYSTGTDGDGNRCEKPGVWNDSGTIGCTYYCDSPPDVTLLYPPNNVVDLDGDIEFTCQSTDNYKLVNVTLYHNITGTWQANQTINISGTLNITTFYVYNIPDETIFIWNCLAYDNKSRSSFADANWSVDVSLDKTPPYFTNLSNQSIYNNESLNYDINASDEGVGVECFSVNDTINFGITCSGVLTNVSGLSVQMYLLNISVNDTQGNLNSSVIYVNVSEELVDTIPPSFTDGTPQNQTLTYANALAYDINATDETALDSFSINDTTNFKIDSATGLLENNTILGVNEYYLNITINDSSNNLNSTVMLVNVTKTTSLVYTYINNSRSNLTMGNHISIWLNGTLQTGEGNIKLYVDDVLYNEGSSPLVNNTFFSIALHNITTIYESTQNYSASYETWWVNVSDTTLPNVSINTPLNQSYGVSSITFNVTGLDDVEMSGCWYSLNNGVDNVSLSQEGNDYVDTNSTMGEGSHTALFWCNDTSDNVNGSESVSFIVDTTAPTLSEILNFNETFIVDGDVEWDDNVSFNVTVTDDNSDVESVWLKIWSGVAEVSSVIWQGFLSLVSGDLFSVSVQTNESFNLGENNYTIYANDSVGNEVSQNGSFDIVLPDDTNKFYVKNSLGENVAWLGDSGNIVLEGYCIVGDCSTPGDNSLVVRNSTKDYVAYINSTGDLCISSGDCSDKEANCDNPTDSVAVRDISKNVVSYINGSLCLIGGLYEGVGI